jgi:hypothetical protein
MDGEGSWRDTWQGSLAVGLGTDSASLFVFPALLLTLSAALLLALFRFLCATFALRSVVLPLRPWCLLLMLGRALLRLPLMLSARRALLLRPLGCGRSLNVSASPLRWLSARGRWCALLE